MSKNVRVKRLLCTKCGQEIKGAPLSFGGAFACRGCVEAYYKPHGREIVELECTERAAVAVRMLRSQKISLE